MKTKKYSLALAVITAILCTPALGEKQFLLPTADFYLIGLDYPELAYIESLNVIVVPPDSEPNKAGLVWKELKEKVESKLKRVGIKIADSIQQKDISRRSLYIPDLKVDIDMLKLKDLQLYVFHIQTSFARSLNLFPSQVRLTLIKSDVWRVPPVMQAVSGQSMPAKVTEVVLEQVEVFIAAWLAANPKGVQSADPNQVSISQREATQPAAKSEVTEYKYVASKNSKVFHSPECRWAKRIKPENLVSYNNREDAIKAGRRPCKVCKP